ncbi:MAG: FadR family transcriptional regulator [Lachnospiraceae bacterium]|nr:FadR family transcriptional regulator [Lachnospiraceae bacterium]
MAQPIRRDDISSQIYNRFLERITSNEWPDGTKLPTEMQLAKEYGVSRSAIREALQRLRAIGMIESRQGVGSFVNTSSAIASLNTVLYSHSVNAQNIFELLEFRKLFEPHCVRLVAQQASDEDILSLKQFAPSLSELGQQKPKIKDLQKLTFEMDIDFHQQIVRLTKNSLFNLIYDVISSIRLSHIDYFINLRMDYAVILDEHNAIYEALKVRDGELASTLMYDHLVYILNQSYFLQDH